MNTRKSTLSMMTAVALTIAAPFVKADDSTTHNPYTVLGVQLRAALLADAADGSSAISVGPAVFQEIVPCRFISTLNADHYPADWGGPSFAPNESRSYVPTGTLVSGDFVNPCSDRIPVESLAVAARIWASGSKSAKSSEDTIVWLTPGHGAAPDKLSKIAVRKEIKTMAEASVVLRDRMFTVTAQNVGADLAIDIIGYFLPDTYGIGAKGDKGDAGAVGATGPAGPQGEAGAKGDKGDAGAVGPAGPAGPQGEAGAKGDKGDKGDAGAQGAKGDTGAQGPKGDKGDTGAQGAQGPMGPQGPQGLQGPQGPPGSGAWVSSENCMGRGENSVTLQNPAVHASSAILVTVTGRSLGNTISVLAQGEGWVTISGKPATCFRYIVFN